MKTVIGTDKIAVANRQQEPFTRVAPVLKVALWMGAGGGFLFATIIGLVRAFSVPAGMWEDAFVQAHGHLQVYGWAGLFVLGVALHFLPRLRGTPLYAPQLVPWFLVAQTLALLLRALGQPLLVMTNADLWRGVLIASGLLECGALLGLTLLLTLTALRGPALSTRPAFVSVLPFVVAAFCSLVLAAVVNLFNMFQAAYGNGLVPGTGDTLSTTLGLFGFLVMMVLAMSARSLPMYAGLEAFPTRSLWPLAASYILGLLLLCVNILPGGVPFLSAAGMFLPGAVLLIFVGVFLRLMRSRGRLPKKVANLAREPQSVARAYVAQVGKERGAYGPFVALVASSYLWALLAGVLLIGNALALLVGMKQPFALDAIRHSLAVGFIALLISGVAPRMLPGFSAGKIASAKLVSATFWLGNSAALFRVTSALLAPLINYSLSSILLGLSGSLGLVFAFCLLVNLWPALGPRR